MREEEGKTRRGKDGKEKNRKEKEKDDQVVPIIKASRRAQPDASSQKKQEHKTYQSLSHTKNTHKRLFDFGVFCIGFFFCIGWVGFGLKTLTANTQSTLPGLRSLLNQVYTN